MRHICPVCGYPNLENEPKNHEICSSCGTQFGYDDFLRSRESLRQQWVDSGAKWFLEGFEPYKWNGYSQLRNAGFLDVKEEPDTEEITIVKTNYKKFRVFTSNFGNVITQSNLLVTGISGKNIGVAATVG
jgi:hypothetical protein